MIASWLSIISPLPSAPQPVDSRRRRRRTISLREERYDGDRMEVEHREHGNMPKWAEADPRAYWQAADDNERANGRLFCQVEGALPIELGPEDRQALARRFARRLTDREQLPYTLAVHRGGHTNPHFHLVISERRNDGIERSAEQWFKRYNGRTPSAGGRGKPLTHTEKSGWGRSARSGPRRRTAPWPEPGARSELITEVWPSGPRKLGRPATCRRRPS